MNREILLPFIEKRFSTRKIANELGLSQMTVRYWLKKHNLTTVHPRPLMLKKSVKSEKLCTKCNTIKPRTDFYIKKEGTLTGYCKKCSNQDSIDRQRRMKLLALEYKGAKCIRCGYDKFYGALEFHHRNGADKKFGIAQKNYLSLSEIMKSELDKCDVLCSNCHREVHNEMRTIQPD